MLQIDINKYFKNIIPKEDIDEYEHKINGFHCFFEYNDEISKKDYDGDITEKNENLFDLIVNDYVLKGKDCLAIFNVLFEISDMKVQYNKVEKDNGYISVNIEIDITSKFEGEEFVIIISNYYSGNSVFALKMNELRNDESDEETEEESEEETEEESEEE